MNANEKLVVTNINDIRKDTEVKLPGWDEKPFICRLRRPALLALAKSGKIPNPLMTCANELFTKGTAEKASLSEMHDLLRIVAGAALVEPTLDDLDNAGIELTDQQLMTIFNYSQIGVNALARFR